MAKKILVIPDIHGETFWKEPVQKYLEQVDRIIFLGDYLDPYRSHLEKYNFDAIYNNLMEIIDLKQNQVVLERSSKGNGQSIVVP